jgi:hypothetical protein
VWAGRATPGSELMNLRYRDERALAAAERAASHAAAGPSGRGGGGGAAAAGKAPSWVRGGALGRAGGAGVQTWWRTSRCLIAVVHRGASLLAASA